jgi:hypothetical protein
MCIMLYGSLYYLLSLYSNLWACQGPKSREVDNSIKVIAGGIFHTSKAVLWELARGRMCSFYLRSKKDVTDLKAISVYLIIVVTKWRSGQWYDNWSIVHVVRRSWCPLDASPTTLSILLSHTSHVYVFPSIDKPICRVAELHVKPWPIYFHPLIKK